MSKEPRSEVVSGVAIISRHGIERELVRMRRAVAGLPDNLRSDVAEIFCDSKAGNHYIVEVRTPECAPAIASYLISQTVCASPERCVAARFILDCLRARHIREERSLSASRGLEDGALFNVAADARDLAKNLGP